MKEEINNWWKQALHDLEAAEYNFEGDLLDSAAFLSQQSVEKALKALYIQEKNQLKKTPSISGLAKDLGLPSSPTIKISELEPAYQKTRYPDIAKKIPAEDFEKADVEEFINTAQEVIAWIEEKLKL
ncbi:HEPN domain-containing protein [Candidatus Pacearchaeota archaeon]|nr:HEPN domain-containing protein [Candidatus Pacearchaeota archaeon]